MTMNVKLNKNIRNSMSRVSGENTDLQIADEVLVDKTDRYTEFQFYLYYDSTRFGQPFCPSSGVLSRTSFLVRFMQL